MSVPDFQSIFLPLLTICGDGIEHTYAETISMLAEEFRLTEEERYELLPSGKQPKFDNRIYWAKTHLDRAGLIKTIGRGKFQITRRGLEVLESNVNRIDIKFLDQFPEYVEFRYKGKESQKPEEAIIPQETTQTPEEILEITYQQLKSQLAQELLSTIKSCSPKFFERLVVDLLVAMGYGGSRREAGKAVGQSGDDGIDGIINEDRLGLDVVYIQAKRWQSVVGRPDIQGFAGSLEGFRARKGVFITTSSFSTQAEEYVKRIEKKIVLIDGEQLAQLMIEHGVGVAVQDTYVIKKIDSDYFNEY